MIDSFDHVEDVSDKSQSAANLVETSTVRPTNGAFRHPELSESEPEPFESSSDEYQPSAASSTSSHDTDIEDRYVGLSENENSDEHSTPNKALKNVSRRLFEDGCGISSHKKTNTIETPIPVATTKDDFSPNADCSCIISVTERKVCLEIVEGMHTGTFSGKMRMMDENTYVGHLPKISVEPTHKCIVPTAEEVDGYFSRTMKDKEAFKLTVTACYPKPCSFVGVETFVSAARIMVTVLKGYPQMSEKDVAASTSALPGLSGIIGVCPRRKNTKNRKTHCCIFCKKMVAHLSRHFFILHKDQNEVINIKELPLKSKERVNALRALRLKGDQAYNRTCSDVASKICVRDSKVVKPSAHCQKCGALLAKRNFARHHAQCTGRPINHQRVFHTASVADGFENIPPAENERVVTISEPEDELVRHLLSNLSDDEVTYVLKEDRTIMLLAKFYANLHKGDLTAADNSRQQLRRCARLLIEVRDMYCDIHTMEDCLNPKNYSKLMVAIQKLCGYDPVTCQLEKPAVASLFRHILSHLASQLSLFYVKEGSIANQDKINSLNDFMQVHQLEFRVHISRSAWRSMQSNKLSKRHVLPSLQDTKKFNDYILDLKKSSKKKLMQDGFDYKYWYDLGKCLLMTLLIFNRRRVGEMSMIELKNYYNKQQVSDNDKQYLNRLQGILANNYQVFYIRGKRSRRLPIVVSNVQVEEIDFFLSFRESARVVGDNPYLFGSNHMKGFINGANVMREFSNRCNATNPETLRGTLLRKQVATLSQMLTLNDNEIQQLADYMGHDVEVHKAVYRTPELTTHITKLTKFFMAIGDPDINRFRGKTIEELDITIENEKNHETDEDDEDSEDDTEVPPAADDDAGVSSAAGDAPELPLDNVKVRKPSDPHPSCSEQHDICPSISDLPKKVDKKRKGKANVNPNKKHKKQHNVVFDSPRTLPARKLRSKIPWTPSQKSLMQKVFKEYIDSSKMPKLSYCAQIAQKYAAKLKFRKGASLYAWIQSENRRMGKY